MKKRKIAILFAAVFAMVSTACGETEAREAYTAEEETKEPTELTVEGGGETIEIKEAASPTSEAAEPTAQPTIEAAAEPTVEAVPEKAVFEEAFLNGEVEQNGSYFVRIGNEVYFCYVPAKELPEGAVFGRFLSAMDEESKAVLMRYDLNSCNYEEVCGMPVSGRLYATTDGFYLGDAANSLTYFLDPVSGEESVYCSGEIVGISEDGRILAVNGWQTESDSPYLYTALVRDGMETARFTDEDGSLIYTGFYGDTMIGIFYDYEDGETSLLSVGAGGEITELGDIEYPAGVEDAYASAEMFLSDDEGVYLSLAYYEGSAQVLTAWQLITAVPAAEDSLRVLEEKDAIALGVTKMPHIYLSEPGVVKTAANVAGDLVLSDGYSGDLLRYMDTEHYQTLVRDFCLPAESRDDGLDSMMQEMVVLRDTAFVIYADVSRDEAYDLGWREGYKLEWWFYVAIPFGEEYLDGEGMAEKLLYMVSESGTEGR